MSDQLSSSGLCSEIRKIPGKEKSWKSLESSMEEIKDQIIKQNDKNFQSKLLLESQVFL
jgi:hypothetical protein